MNHTFLRLRAFVPSWLHRTPPRRAFTLVETLVAVSVLGILSLAAYTLLHGTLNTDAYLRTATQNVSELELAARRITHNVRTAAAITSPATTTPTTSLTLVTQPDAANNYTPYTVTYALAGSQLQEIDSRYGTNILVHNVAANGFAVTLQRTTSPISIQITLTLATTPAMTRTLTLYARNL